MGKVRDVFLKYIRVVVEDNGNQHENVEFGFRIREDLLEDEREMLKNMSKIQKLDRTRLPCLIKLNDLWIKIESKDVTEDNNLFFLGAAALATAFEKNKTKGEKKQTW